MLRGVSCVLEDCLIPKHLLRDVLADMDTSKYVWAVDCIVELSDNDFEEKVYDGACFSREIQSEHLLNFLRVRRYSKGAMIDDRMENYEDYQKSGCSLVFLCVDCYYLDIYVKDADEQASLFAACQKLKYKEFEYITDTNDGRTGFVIW